MTTKTADGCGRTGGTQKFEVRLVRPDGALLWVHLQSALADDDEYRITAIDTGECAAESAEQYVPFEKLRKIKSLIPSPAIS